MNSKKPLSRIEWATLAVAEEVFAHEDYFAYKARREANNRPVLEYGQYLDYACAIKQQMHKEYQEATGEYGWTASGVMDRIRKFMHDHNGIPPSLKKTPQPWT